MVYTFASKIKYTY